MGAGGEEKQRSGVQNRQGHRGSGGGAERGRSAWLRRSRLSEEPEERPDSMGGAQGRHRGGPANRRDGGPVRSERELLRDRRYPGRHHGATFGAERRFEVYN